MADAQAIVSGQDVREQERVGRAGRSVVVAAGQAVGVPQRHPVAEHRHRLRASVGAPLTRISPDSRRPGSYPATRPASIARRLWTRAPSSARPATVSVSCSPGFGAFSSASSGRSCVDSLTATSSVAGTGGATQPARQPRSAPRHRHSGTDPMWPLLCAVGGSGRLRPGWSACVDSVPTTRSGLDLQAPGGSCPTCCVHGRRQRGLIVILWRAGLRIQEALALADADLDRRRGAWFVGCGAARAGGAARSARTRGVGKTSSPGHVVSCWLSLSRHACRAIQPFARNPRLPWWRCRAADVESPIRRTTPSPGRRRIAPGLRDGVSTSAMPAPT